MFVNPLVDPKAGNNYETFHDEKRGGAATAPGGGGLGKEDVHRTS